MCSLCFLPIFGPDVIDEGHGDVNVTLNVHVRHVEGVEFVRLFDEQLLQNVQFLPHILTESVD